MSDGDFGDFRLRLFQSWQLLWDATIVHVAPRQQRLITALAIHGPRPRNYLLGLLWPEHSEPNAQESLRVCVHLISRQVPGLLINGGAVLSLNERVDVDLHRMRLLIRQLSQAGPNSHAASACVHDLRQADLLPGWYQDWIIFEQTRLKQARLHALLVIASESLSRCNYDVALEASEAAVELEPLYERAVQLLIQSERKQGNRASALRAFEKYQALLSADLGIAPSEAIRRLVADVR